MAIPLGDTNPKPAPSRRWGVFGKTVHGIGWVSAGPWHWFGAQRIGRSAVFIAHLIRLLRVGPAAGDGLRQQEDGSFDLRATAFLHGLTSDELRRQLDARRRQTARIAYAALTLACAFLVAWLWQALSSPWTGARIASTVEFLPFCALFFLTAFYNALLNFQIRTGRTATWREYLMTDDAFLPR